METTTTNGVLTNDQITSSENLQTKSFDSMILAPSPQTKRKIIDKSKKQNEKKQLLFKKTDSTALTTEMLETLHSNLKSSCKKKFNFDEVQVSLEKTFNYRRTQIKSNEYESFTGLIDEFEYLLQPRIVINKMK